MHSQYFLSVFTAEDPHVPEFEFDCNNCNINSCVVLATEVEKKLQAPDPNKGTGPDVIPPSVLKYCAPILAPHLAVMFNKLLTVGIFPPEERICCAGV